MTFSIATAALLSAVLCMAAPPALVTSVNINAGDTVTAVAVNPSTNLIYVVDGTNSTVSVLDGMTNGINSVVPVPRGTGLYVAVNKLRNQFAVTGDNLGEVFDANTNTPIVPITASSTVFGPAAFIYTVVNEVTNKLYSSTLGSILVTDLSTGSISLLSNPSLKPGDICTVHSLAVNSAANWVYATVQCSLASSVIFVIDGTTGATLQAVDLGGSVPIGANIGEIVLNTASNKLYVANYGGFGVQTGQPVPPSVEVYNATNITHLASIPGVVGPLAVDPGLNAIYGIAFVCCSGALIDGSTDTLNSTFQLGFSVSGLASIPIAANPATHMVYYLNQNGGTVSIFQGSLPSSGTFTISGQLTGSGATGVTILAQGGSQFSAVTDAGGAYTLSGISPGAYTVTPSTPGRFYSPSSKAVNVTTANIAGVNFAALAQPVTIQTLTLSPFSTIASGVTTNGTVTINQTAPAGGVVVTLASGNKVAKVPASLTIAAGSSSATFAIQASGVNSPTPVTITASYSGSLAASASSASVVLTVAPTDTLHVQSATWSRSSQILNVTATSTNPQAILTLLLASGNVNLGTFTNLGGGNFSYSAPFATGTPASVNVKSNLGGSTGQGVTIVP